MRLKCKNSRCKHEWDYSGKSKIYACCPKCLYKVNIKKCHIKTRRKIENVIKDIEKGIKKE